MNENLFALILMTLSVSTPIPVKAAEIVVTDDFTPQAVAQESYISMATTSECGDTSWRLEDGLVNSQLGNHSPSKSIHEQDGHFKVRVICKGYFVESDTFKAKNGSVISIHKYTFFQNNKKLSQLNAIKQGEADQFQQTIHLLNLQASTPTNSLGAEGSAKSGFMAMETYQCKSSQSLNNSVWQKNGHWMSQLQCNGFSAAGDTFQSSDSIVSLDELTQGGKKAAMLTIINEGQPNQQALKQLLN